MLFEHLGVVVGGIYFALTLGVMLKFVAKGVRGVALSISFFVPLLLILVPIGMYAFLSSPKRFTDEDRERFERIMVRGRLRLYIDLVVGCVQAFPLITGVIGTGLANSLASSRELRGISVTEMFTTFFSDFYRASLDKSMKTKLV